MSKIRCDKLLSGVSLGTFLGVVGILVAFMLTFFALWVGAEREIRKLLSELAARKENAIALIRALDERLPTGSNKWEKYHGEHPIQFYVTDHLGCALASATIVVAQTGEQTVTNEGGLTSTLWMVLGDKVSFERSGFHSEKLVFDREAIRSRVISVKLRRIENGKESLEK